MKSFDYEKRIFHILVLFIVATDIICSEPKASNANPIRQLKIEKPDIEILGAAKNLSKLTPIKC